MQLSKAYSIIAKRIKTYSIYIHSVPTLHSYYLTANKIEKQESGHLILTLAGKYNVWVY